MLRIAYVWEYGSFVGKAAVYMLFFMLIGIPLLFIITIAIQDLIDRIKEKKRR